MFRPLLAAVLLAAVAAAPAWAQSKKPANCAAVSFRPAENLPAEGEVRAGHYPARFGAIDLIARVQAGQPAYHVLVNQQPLKRLDGEIPKSAHACLKSRNIQTPPKPVEGACAGPRFRVAVDSSGKQKLVMLFALAGDEWRLCEAGTPATR